MIIMKFVGIFIILLATACYASPSIVDYSFIIDGNSTNSSVVYISPLSSPGVQDGLRISITADEPVNWTIKILNSTGSWVAPGNGTNPPWKEPNSTIIIKPDTSCTVWSGTKKQCDGENLIEGNYIVNVSMKYINSTDNNTNEISDLSRTIIIDNTPPAAPLVNARSVNSTVQLNWSAQSDINFMEFFVYRSADGINFLLVNETNITSFSEQLSNALYYYKVLEKDMAGNENESIINMTVNYTSPYAEVSIESPLNTTYNTTNISLSYKISAGSCFYSLDNLINTTLENCTNTTFIALDGAHFLQLFSNNSGNINSSNVSFSIDTQAPELLMQSPTSTTYSSTSVSLSYTTSGIRCYYELNNVVHSLTDCGNASITASTGSNNLVLYSKDHMNNTNFTSVSFTVSIPAPPSSPPPTNPPTTQNNQNTNQKPPPPKNTTTNQANSTNQSAVNNTVVPAAPPAQKENSALQNNTASNQSSIFGITGALFANPLPIALAALAVVIIIIIAAFWKFFRRTKPKDGTVKIM